MATDAETLVVEFVDAHQGMVGIATGPWHDEPEERMALDLLGGLRLKKARASQGSENPVPPAAITKPSTRIATIHCVLLVV